MTIHSIFDPEFKPYGVPLPDGYDTDTLLGLLRQETPCPADGIVYVPSDDKLEALPIFNQLEDRLFGGLPIQIGYCNGNNHTLNALEYHRGSEADIAADDVVLLLAEMRDLENGKLDTAKVKAFALPAGKGALLFETTLHYAPCNGAGRDGFRVIIVLPRGTNTDKPGVAGQNPEDALLWARNKWLLAHPDSPEAAQGAHVGLEGENISV